MTTRSGGNLGEVWKLVVAFAAAATFVGIGIPIGMEIQRRVDKPADAEISSSGPVGGVTTSGAGVTEEAASPTAEGSTTTSDFVITTSATATTNIEESNTTSTTKTFLDLLQFVDTGGNGGGFLQPTTSIISMAGDEYARGVYASGQCSQGSTADSRWGEYDLSKDWKQLTGTVGISDKSEVDSRGVLNIYGDGRLLTSAEVEFGSTTPIDISLQDVLRMRLEFIDYKAPSRSCGTGQPGTAIVLAGAQLAG